MALAHSFALGLLLVAGFAAAADDAALPELDCLVEPFQIIDVGSARGIVKTVSVDRSDAVSASDVLVQLDDEEQRATVRQARARAGMNGDLRAREAALAFAERKLARISELFASDAISSYQRDEVQTELEMARQELRQAQEARDLARLDLARAQVELAKRTIRSPVDGIVVERFVGPGEFVNDTPLVRVAQMNPLRVEAIAPAALYGNVRAGMLAQVRTEVQGGRPLTAKVTIVDRLIDPASGTFGIRLELPNPDYAIPSGLNCRLQLEALAADETPATGRDARPERPVHDAPMIGVLSAAMTPKRAAVTAPAPVPSPAKAQTQAAGQVAAAVRQAGTAPVGAKGPRPTLRPATLLPTDTGAACITLGPIDDERLWRKLQLVLAAEPVAVTARSDEQAGDILGYFVVTARADTMEQARNSGAELRRKGVSDLAVLTRPPYEQRLSLGLYSSMDGARTRKAQVDALGLGVTTEILPRTRALTAHWLDVSATADVLDARPWSALAPDLDASACADGRYVAEATTGAR